MPERNLLMLRFDFLVRPNRMRIFLIGLLLVLTMTACGTKGPLYIPEQRYPQEAN